MCCRRIVFPPFPSSAAVWLLSLPPALRPDVHSSPFVIPESRVTAAVWLRAELIKRELATADELVVDEAGEAAMTAFNAAKERAAASIAASKVVREAEIKRDRVAAALNAAQHNEANAGLKRQLAQGRLTLADMQVKVAKAATPLMSEKATSKTVPLRATLDAFLRPAPPK